MLHPLHFVAAAEQSQNQRASSSFWIFFNVFQTLSCELVDVRQAIRDDSCVPCFLGRSMYSNTFACCTLWPFSFTKASQTNEPKLSIRAFIHWFFFLLPLSLPTLSHSLLLQTAVAFCSPEHKKPPSPQKNILYMWLIKVGRWGGLRLAKQELLNNTHTHTHKGQFQPDAYPTHLFFSAYPLVNINWPVTLRGMGGSIQYLLKIGILCERNTIQLLTNKGKQNTNVNGLSFDSVWLKSNQTNSFTQRTIKPTPPSQ